MQYGTLIVCIVHPLMCFLVEIIRPFLVHASLLHVHVHVAKNFILRFMLQTFLCSHERPHAHHITISKVPNFQVFISVTQYEII